MANSTTTTYLQDLTCQISYDPTNTSITTDGKGEQTFSPTDLVGAATASCIATMMAIQAQALKLNISGLKLSVQKTMSSDRPRRITQMDITCSLPINPSEKDKALLLKAADNCPVFNSLHPDIKKNISYIWNDNA